MFVSYGFIFFVCALVIIYYLVPKKVQWVLLLIASLGFYASIDVRYLIFVGVTATTVFLAGIWMGSLRDKCDSVLEQKKEESGGKIDRAEKKEIKRKFASKQKAVMLVCLFVNLGILAITKYTGFVIINLDKLLPSADKISVPNLVIPLGISFYTFQAVGYLLDVYWERCGIQKNWFRFLLFVTFFPQMVQGPISRYDDLQKTLYGNHKFDTTKVGYGFQRVLWGYFKKLVIADRMAVAVAALTADSSYYTGGYVLVTMIFWAIELYADFTGGIDITIGIAQMLGIDLAENFIRPFFSKNITEYWRRWHITMGTWFRDYVFYPFSISRPLKSLTGFSKKHFGLAFAKRVAVYLSTLIVWVATGIWHGAAWHYVAWGLANGVILLITGELEPLYQRFRNRYPKLVASWGYKLFMVGRTFLLMCCIRLFDVYNSARIAIRQFVRMFTDIAKRPVKISELMDMGLGVYDYIVIVVGVVLMIIVSVCSRDDVSVREKLHNKTPYAVRYALFLMLFFATILHGMYGQGVDAAQFIYNQF